MFLGLDIGTSGVKAVVIDHAGSVVAHSRRSLTVSRPQPTWSEQDPAIWWANTDEAVQALPGDLRANVEAIGLAGQMHGAVLLDRNDQPLRPAILWNDGRSAAECAELEAIRPDARTITGNAAMPGFTAPKLLWVRRHEPEIPDRIAKVLLPKDYVRLCMTGDHATDASDASGTLWLDVGRRAWSPEMLAACGLGQEQMPSLHEGTEITGQLRGSIAARWGMRRVPVVAGGSDNAAGAVGCGAIRDGAALLSLGTSGVVFVANAKFSPAPDRGAHAFCHALPGLWHQMAVLLSAGASLEWIRSVLGLPDAAAAFAAAEASGEPFSGPEIFLPYLSGERTPHNNPQATGVLFGLTHQSESAALVRTVLEGVAFAFCDGLAVLEAGGASIQSLTAIGGGARSTLWARIIAAALDKPLVYGKDAHVGPAFGAARLAQIGATGARPDEVAKSLAFERIVMPEPDLVARAQEKLASYRALYPALERRFAPDPRT